MSGIGTNIDLNISSNFDFLQNLKENQKLKFKVELGYLDIPSRQTFPMATVADISNSAFYSPPGGTRGESFVNNETLRKLKTAQLRPVTNGLMANHLDITGAPWSTFLAGTILPGETHPYYNLIRGPKDAPTFQSTSTLEYNTDIPEIQDQQYQALNDPLALSINKLGEPFIPATTFTSSAVEKAGLPVLDTYNIWSIDNIESQYYDFQKYLGYLPKNSADVNRLQPYAQTWSYANNSQIHVYASLSQVKLTRIYPIVKDYAHQGKSLYCIFDSATGAPQLQKRPVGLTHPTPVGFSLKFSNIVTNNSQPVQVGAGNDANVVNPQIIISWGDLSSDQNALNKYNEQKIIGKYSIVLNTNTPPKLYFNIADPNKQENTFQANQFNIELSDLPPITSSDKQTSDKVTSEYNIYVYFTGEYLMIGSKQEPASWQTIRNQEIIIRTDEGEEIDRFRLFHNLKEIPNAKINIQAQFCNFVFSYGPALFKPQDNQNIPANSSSTNERATSNLFNTNNFITGNIPYNAPNLEEKPTAQELERDILSFINNNSASTYERITDNDNREYGGASYYADARAVTNDFEVVVKDLKPGSLRGKLSYKITFPNHLGGTVFNKFLPTKLSEPQILESYAKYDLGTVVQSGFDRKGNPLFSVSGDISTILSQSVSGEPSITTKVDNYRLESTLSIEFLNLNRSEIGLKILNFMRKNICVLRVSAGYDHMHYYFEGMIENVSVSESLSETKITVTAKDLLDRLFINNKTQIISKVQMQFPGMKFDKIIKSIYQYTELYKHFEYDLGAEVPGTIYYYLKNCKEAALSKLMDSGAQSNLSKLFIGAYDAENSIWSCLETIAKLLIQTNTELRSSSSACKPNRFDVPIYYWLTNGSVDGIAMSSRTLLKDRDVFYIRTANISELMTKDVSLLHGYLRAGDAFKSSSNADNLFATGIYRGLDIDGVPFSLQEFNSGAFRRNNNLLEEFDGYIGYDKIVIFDKGDASIGSGRGETTLGNKILNEKYGKKWLQNVFSAVYLTVYEQIEMETFVTKPLKVWGNFGVCIESDDVQIPETFLYNSVSYRFKLNENLIEASVSGSKKPIQY